MKLDAFSSNYEEVLDRRLAFSGEGAAWYARRKADRLRDLARARWDEPARILDVGCGAGLMLAALDPETFPSPSGTDASEAMVESAQAAVPVSKVVPCPESGPLPFPDASFDVTFTACTMHHVEVPLRPGFVAEMARVTRPAGLVVVFEHNPWNPVTRAIVAGCEFDRGVVLLPAGEVCSLMRSAGLLPHRPHYYLFIPPRLQFLGFLERYLHWLPLGGQYFVPAEVP